MTTINSITTPVWLQRLQWVLDPVTYMKTAFKQYPDLFSNNIVPVENNNDLFFIQHPQALQQLLTSDRREFTAPGEYNKILEPLLGPSSIVSLDGEKHRRERKLLMPSFHGERMHAYGHLIQEITQQVFTQFSPTQPFIARVATQQISLQVILQAVFGVYQGERYEKIAKLVRSMLNYFISPFNSIFLFFTSLQKDLGAWSPWGSFVRTRQQLDKLIYEEISDRNYFI